MEDKKQRLVDRADRNINRILQAGGSDDLLIFWQKVVFRVTIELKENYQEWPEFEESRKRHIYTRKFLKKQRVK